MSLIRFKPVPTDRMAAIWTLSQVRDAVIVDYGPAGTTTFARRKIGNMNVDTSRLVSTHLDEHDIIMGDPARLERAVTAADEKYHPPVIFVVPSAILTATGADTAGICRAMEDRVRADLLVFEGVGRDYSAGLRSVYSLLVENLCLDKAAARIPHSCNLLGLSASSPTAERDAREIRELLQRSFGSEILLELGLSCCTEDFRNACRAELNVVLRREALDAAAWMERTLGIPFVYLPPYGYEGTERFLKAVGEKLGMSPEASVLETLRLRQADAEARPPRAPLAVMGDYDLVAGLSRFAETIGGHVDAAVCCHDLSGTGSSAGNVVYYEKERDWIDVFSRLHGDLVVGDERVAYTAPRDNVLLIVSNSELMEHGAYTGPLMGIGGADQLLRLWR